MKKKTFDTLSEAVNFLTKEGFTDDFKAGDEHINALYSRNSYAPSDLKVVGSYRFEGMTNPQDQSILLALEASDGVKGTLTVSYSAEHNQNMDLIRQIDYADE